MAVTLAEIAALAGVSRGTVDRALNDRGRVDPKVAARVRRIAAERGYRPNRAGRMLARAKNPIRIGVIVQSVETMFMHTVFEEIERASAHFTTTGAEVLVRPLEGVDAQQQLDVIDELLEAGVQGIALSPAEDERVRARIQELSERMPVVLLVAGQENNWSHQQRVDGFQAEAAANFPGLSLLPPQTCGDDQQLAHDIVCRAVQEHPSLRGVYVSVNGQLGACDALRELGLQGKVHLICHDLIPANTENVRRGLIDFLIDQDAALQGARPIELLMDYLLAGEKPETDRILACIDIRNRYNV